MTTSGTVDPSQNGSGSATERSVLSGDLLSEIDAFLAPSDARRAAAYPGDSGTRQPVHTVYVNADRATDDLVASWGRQAREILDLVAADATAAARTTGLAAVDGTVLDRVRAKLASQPIEDLRLDFEDGYGARPDAEEDADADRAAALLRDILRGPHAPLTAGIRFKCLEPALRRRGLRTLDRVVGGVIRSAPGEKAELPAGFVVTLPKVTDTDQVRAMVRVCAALEHGYGLAEGALRFEIQVETTQAILATDGTAAVAEMVRAAGPRCIALVYGTFDYSAACGVSPAQQSLAHPVADHAKAVMQVAAAGTGVRLSDGSTNVLPIGTPEAVEAAVRLHSGLVTRSLERAYYQGWDMHPGHLVSRYLATFAFFRAGRAAAADRLRAYLAKQEGAVMDEPATAQALAGLLQRGVHCGAVTVDEIVAAGVDPTLLDALARKLPLPSAPAHDLITPSEGSAR